MVVTNVATGVLEHRLEHHSADVNSVCWSPDGLWIASASKDASVVVVDTSTGKVARRIHHEEGLLSVAWSPDGLRIATGSYDGLATVRDVESGEVLCEIGHQNYEPVLQVAFAPCSTYLASASKDNTVAITDILSGHLIGRGMHHSDTVNAVAFSPDGKVLATVSEDRTAVTVDLMWGFSVHECLKQNLETDGGVDWAKHLLSGLVSLASGGKLINPYTCDSHGRTLLRYAAEHRNATAFQRLLAHENLPTVMRTQTCPTCSAANETAPEESFFVGVICPSFRAHQDFQLPRRNAVGQLVYNIFLGFFFAAVSWATSMASTLRHADQNKAEKETIGRREKWANTHLCW